MNYQPRDIKDVKDLLASFLRKISQPYDRFLEERRKEWATHVRKNYRDEPIDPNPDDPDKEARQRLLKEISVTNELYCRRDMPMPEHVALEQIEKIRQFEGMREKVGKGKHPTALYELSNVLALTNQYADAEAALREAIAINNNIGDLLSTRDNVFNYCDLARMLYKQRHFRQAVDIADESVRLAKGIDITEEKRLHAKFGGDPKNFISSIVVAHFAACDARINHYKWDSNEQLQQECTAYWSDSVTFYDVPNVWLPPLKIAAVSDPKWVNRVRSYVDDIAKSLYIELGANPMFRLHRAMQSKFGLFAIDYSSVPPVAAAVLLVAVMSTAVVGNVYTARDVLSSSNFDQIAAVFETPVPDVIKDQIEDQLGNRVPLTSLVNETIQTLPQRKDEGIRLATMGSQRTTRDV
jgi:tetratricopeptide (TPR) repeat protein